MDSINPFYIDGTKGKLFALYHRPLTKNCRGAILYAPPFAEEMNKSRAMAAKQARAFAAEGYAVLLVDYYGTGDSEGEFREASLNTWAADFNLCLDWLVDRQSGPVYLWGLRFGCLLAASAGYRRIDDLQGALFWAPILNGNEIVTDLLRLERVARVLNRQEAKQTAAEHGLKEIAGYQISAELLDGLKALRLEDRLLGNQIWMHISVASNDAAVSNSAKRLQAAAPPSQHILELNIVDKRFWLTPEITLAPHVLEQTTTVFLNRFCYPE